MKIQFIRYSIVTCRILLCSILFSNVYAQQKRILTPKDFKLWHESSKIGNAEVSNDGKWFAYRIINKKANDTVYLRNTLTKQHYSFAIFSKGSTNVNKFKKVSINFSDDSKWFALGQNDSSILLNLRTGKTDFLKGLANLTFSAQSQFLIGFKKDSLSNSLVFKNLKNLKTITINHVKEYSFNIDKSILGVINDDKLSTQVISIYLKSELEKKELATGNKLFFKSLKWNTTGISLTFTEVADGGSKVSDVQKIYVATHLNKNTVVKIFNPKSHPGLTNNANSQVAEIYLSDDAKQLIFNLREEAKIEDNNNLSINKAISDVQIWRSDDTDVPPRKKVLPYQWRWYVWWTETGKLIEITDREHYFMSLSGDQKKALLYNRSDYLPQHKYGNSFINVYIRDMESGQKKLLLNKVKYEPYSFLTSPTGKYLTYFKDKNWWVYDIYKDTHNCITNGLNVAFENIELESTGVVSPFGNPGWIQEDTHLLIYDQYDIWLISPDGSDRKRITNGRKNKTTFRIYKSDSELGLGIGNGDNWFSSKGYSSEDGILITSLNNYNLNNGLWNWNKKSGMFKYVEKGLKLSPLSNIKGNKPFLFTESTFEISTRLMLHQPLGNEKLIYQTNPQQQDFYWGKSELIHYKADGKELKGALFYPANYDSSKKYPMIVEVYEKGRSKQIHSYIEPSEAVDKSDDTINATSYTLDDYFVLFPDIGYELNNPGISATNCVLAAVKKVIDLELVDKEKIGLTGHSFGGYETNFIITQTNLFKAAIAGSGITDLPDWYLEVSGFGVNLTRVEEDQFRMTTPFYGEDFRRNSPMDNIENIKTPLLIWTGDKDTNVDWTQSRKFQIALWRLGKESTLLVYPGEGHSLSMDINVKDLGIKMKDWFDYYLKDKPPAPWILGEQMK